MKKSMKAPNFDYMPDLPFQQNPENKQRYNGITYANMPGVQNSNKICINKSDFRPVTGSERGTKV